MNKHYEYVIELTSKLTGYDKALIKGVYDSVWKFIKKDIGSYSNNDDLLRRNSYSIYKIGKLYAREELKNINYDCNKEDLTTK